MNGDQVESPDTPLSFDTNTIALPLTAANPVSNLVEVVPDHTEAPPETNKPTTEENTCLESVSSHLQPAAEDTTEESSSATASDEQGVSTEESKDQCYLLLLMMNRDHLQQRITQLRLLSRDYPLMTRPHLLQMSKDHLITSRDHPLN